MLEPNQVIAIESRLRGHRKAVGVQMAVLLIRTTDGRPIDWYSLDVAKKWGGGKKGRDDGLLFILAVDDHRMRLEVGYGLEPSIPDREARRIIDSIKPELRAGMYGVGVAKVVEEVILRTSDIDPETGKSTWRPPLGTAVPGTFLITLLAGILFGFLAFRIMRKIPWWAQVLAWIVGPIAVSLVFHEGEAFYITYPFVWLYGVGLVWIGRWLKEAMTGGEILWWLTACGGVIGSVVYLQDTPVHTGVGLLTLLGLNLGAHFGLMLIGLFAILDTGGGSSYSSGGFSSRSSSFSSGGGYSGGGGGFGGGGASSGW